MLARVLLALNEVMGEETLQVQAAVKYVVYEVGVNGLRSEPALQCVDATSLSVPLCGAFGGADLRHLAGAGILLPFQTRNSVLCH